MKFRFTGTELRNIVISVIVLAVAVSGVGFLNWPGEVAILARLAVISLPLVIGFVSHELVHKWVAMKRGYLAFFKIWNFGLLLALLLGLMTNGRILFAAPGAVVIFAPYLSTRENGLISVAGPLTNILLALVFFGISFIGGLIGIVGDYGVFINLWLAFFNLIPIPPFDGSKVFSWNKALWAILEIPLAVVVFQFFL